MYGVSKHGSYVDYTVFRIVAEISVSILLMIVVGIVDNRNLNLWMYAMYTSVREAHTLFYLS